MDEEYGPSEEFIEFVKRIQNDLVYQNETLPAECFIQAHDGLENTEPIRNENDPPDYFIKDINGDLICLEVTSMGPDFAFKHNSFIRQVEEVIRKCIDNNLYLLPRGSYGFFFVASSRDFVETRMGKIQVADFNHKANKSEIEEFLVVQMANFFADYSINEKSHLSVLNKRGEQIGVINIMKLADAESTSYAILPQSYRRLEDWTEDELMRVLQDIVTAKENKYKRMDLKEDLLKMPWWLLISDIHDIMGTAGSRIDAAAIELSYNFFARVFLISQAFKGHRVLQF